MTEATSDEMGIALASDGGKAAIPGDGQMGPAEATAPSRPGAPSHAAVAADSADGWPLRFEPYDARQPKRRTLHAVLIVTAIVVAIIVVGVAGLLAFHSDLIGMLSLLVLIVGVCGIPSIVGVVRDAVRVARLPDGGFQLSEQSILDAYGPLGLAEIRLSTPAIDYSDDGSDTDKYTVHRNGFDALWMCDEGPGGQAVRSYRLWWRDDAHDGLKWLKVGTDRPADIPKEDGVTPGSSTYHNADRMKLFLDAGADLRMWPCMLEVRGRRARLMFDPHAEKTGRGQLDPHITKGIDKVFLLSDTIPPRKAGR